jgi:ubiquinone/menaquinone biosynthesis C-methylase UbiE
MPPEKIVPPIAETISAGAARRYYDFWGQRYDWFGYFESRAKTRLLELLDLSPGMRLLNVGLGTGLEHQQIINLLGSATNAVGVDISWAMLQSAQGRTGAPLCQADGGRLPFASASFDRLYAAYVLDLVPIAELPAWLQAFRRVLRPGGGMLVACLTEGVNAASRSIVSLWKLAYRISPFTCGGCRPLQIGGLVERAGFRIMQNEVIVQLGVPSQVIYAQT